MQIHSQRTAHADHSLDRTPHIPIQFWPQLTTEEGSTSACMASTHIEWVLDWMEHKEERAI